jgi:electron transport complex protein RnfG
MKKIIRLTTSLTLISAVCAAILATVNAVTTGRINTIREKMKQNAARLVLPRSVRTVDALNEKIFAGKAADGRVLAYAVIGESPAGYGGPIELMVGFTPDFQIVTYQKLKASETPGLGTHLSSPSFMKQFKGLDARKDIKVTKDGGTVEAITSATITSRAVCDAVNNAREKLQSHLTAAH